MKHQPPNMHSPGEAAVPNNNSSAKSFSWKSKECTKEFAYSSIAHIFYYYQN